jgi:hypothetical protein
LLCLNHPLPFLISHNFLPFLFVEQPAGEYKAFSRVLLESFCPSLLWTKLPTTYPDYLDGIRPAAGMRPGNGTYGDGYERSVKPDTSAFTPPSF